MIIVPFLDGVVRLPFASYHPSNIMRIIIRKLFANRGELFVEKLAIEL